MQSKKRSILDNKPIVKRQIKGQYECEDNYTCWYCLCDVCTRVHCLRQTFVKSKFARCMYCQTHNLCPVTHCDFFEHKQKFKRFRIIHKKKKYDTVLSELQSLNNKIAEMSKNMDKLTKG